MEPLVRLASCGYPTLPSLNYRSRQSAEGDIEIASCFAVPRRGDLSPGRPFERLFGCVRAVAAYPLSNPLKEIAGVPCLFRCGAAVVLSPSSTRRPATHLLVYRIGHDGVVEILGLAA